MRFTIATLARPADGIDFTSATTAVRTGRAEWVDEGVLEVPFDRDLTTAEVDAVTLLLTSATTAEAGIRKAAQTYLDNPSPTPAQTVTALKGFMRLVLRLYDQQHGNN